MTPCGFTVDFCQSLAWFSMFFIDLSTVIREEPADKWKKFLAGYRRCCAAQWHAFSVNACRLRRCKRGLLMPVYWCSSTLTRTGMRNGLNYGFIFWHGIAIRAVKQQYLYDGNNEEISSQQYSKVIRWQTNSLSPCGNHLDVWLCLYPENRRNWRQLWRWQALSTT